MKLSVHPNKRYLMKEDGSPFFYLGDTAWELFHRLNISEAEYYLSVRARQGFNAVQAVALAEFSGLIAANAYGRFPLKQTDGKYDPLNPDLDGEYSYWAHVDAIIDLAAKKNIYIALLPTWGDKFHKAWGEGPEIFDADNAYAYAKWIATRYRDRENIIWMLGGDRPLATDLHRAVIDSMGKAIREVCPGHLVTFHPPGFVHSAEYVKNKDYIDFHTCQSSHAVDGYRSFELVQKMREAEEKPFLDSEPRYEDHPANFTVDTKYLWNADDVRQNTYWNLMEGVCGNTYGNHNIWSMNAEPVPYFPFRWQEALLHPGAEEAHIAADLRYSRPYFEFRSAPELVRDDSAVMAHFAAGRGEKYAYIYSPLGLPIRACLDKLTDRSLRASWFDPRTGSETLFALVPPRETLFVPPTSGKGQDWVLVLDVVG